MRALAALLAVVSLACLFACGGGGGNPNPGGAAAPATIGDSVGAQIAAEDFVKQYLAFPLDAEFPWLHDANYIEGNGRWVVKSTVKAANALGGKLTQQWTATVSYDAAKNEWSLHYLNIGGETVYNQTSGVAGERPLAEAPSEPTPTEKETAERRIIEEARADLDRRQAEAERKAIERAERDEKAAAAKLALAERLLEMDNRPAAERFLRSILDEYPHTAAVAEAKKLLGE